MKLFTDGNEVHIAVSPQSLSSLTNYFGTESDHDTFDKLSAIFKMIGAKEVYDLSWYNELSLQLSYLEFKDRFLASAKYNTDQLKSVKKGIKWNKDIGHLPLLTSECPGWVCYAEKTIGEEAFPFMSNVKSPQQLCAKMVKSLKLLKGNGCGKAVKFVTVMPCYDKKLEAVRPTMNTPNLED